MKKSVLFFDIDGTLLSEVTHTMPESTVCALHAAQAKGHLLFINTGRTVSSLPAEIRRYPFDGFLCGCGTYLIYKEKVLFQSSIPAQRGKELISMLTQCRLGGVAEGPEDVYFPRNMSRFENLEMSRRYFRARGMGVEQPLEAADFVYDKLFIYADDMSDLDRFLQFASEDMEPIDRGNNTYEVIQKGYSKATACEFILKMLNIDKDDAYVFGDSSNDLSMFEYADHTIAMGKHSEVLEPYTEFITKTVENGGIEWALKHYKLI